ncbi:MAG TPA: hypothetical protein VFC39_21510 [Acidobacteriaceae bacterium]|nr:hypothetical protein [Acidobacteriaceae bacterium]
MEIDFGTPLFKLYGPLVIVAIIIFALIHTGGADHAVLLTLKPFADFVDLHMSITGTFAVRGTLVLLALLSLSSYVFYDYSKFFPQHFLFDVFCDKEGIYEALGAVPRSCLGILTVPDDAETRRHVWMKYLDAQLAPLISLDKPSFVLKGENIHGTGTAEFKMEKRRGLQQYQITVSEGNLKTELDSSGHLELILFSQFSKIPSVYDIVCLTLHDFFVRRGTILRTRYKQSLRAHNKQDLLPDFEVLAVTPVTIFSWPSIGKTVYMVIVDETFAVPFGFAIYR